MSVFDEFLTANQGYTQAFAASDLPIPPARMVAVLMCMDERLHPETFLGLAVGDAHVIRNAGGVRPRMPFGRW
jgi:carbonic anhydrase